MKKPQTEQRKIFDALKDWYSKHALFVYSNRELRFKNRLSIIAGRINVLSNNKRSYFKPAFPRFGVSKKKGRAACREIEALWFRTKGFFEEGKQWIYTDEMGNIIVRLDKGILEYIHCVVSWAVKRKRKIHQFKGHGGLTTWLCRENNKDFKYIPETGRFQFVSRWWVDDDDG